MTRSWLSEKSRKNLYAVSFRANEERQLNAECLFRARLCGAKLNSYGCEVCEWRGDGGKGERKSFSHFHRRLCVVGKVAGRFKGGRGGGGVSDSNYSDDMCLCDNCRLGASVGVRLLLLRILMLAHI